MLSVGLVSGLSFPPECCIPGPPYAGRCRWSNPVGGCGGSGQTEVDRTRSAPLHLGHCFLGRSGKRKGKSWEQKEYEKDMDENFIQVRKHKVKCNCTVLYSTIAKKTSCSTGNGPFLSGSSPPTRCSRSACHGWRWLRTRSPSLGSLTNVRPGSPRL